MKKPGSSGVAMLVRRDNIMQPWLILCLFLICAATNIFAQADSGQSAFAFRGYYKNYSTAVNIPDIPVDRPLLGMVSNRVRLMGSYQPNGWFGLNIAYDLAALVQDSLLNSGGLLFAQDSTSAYRAYDLDYRLYPGENKPVRSFSVTQNLDRLYVSLHAPSFDLYLGRQAIAWGAARVINPTDIFAPFAYNELDTEYRFGIDAVRLRYPLGFFSELDIGYVAGHDFDFDRSAMYVRSRLYASATDISVTAIAFRDNLLVGADMARAIGGAGVWTEAAYVFADMFRDKIDWGQSYFRITAGADYNFAGGVYAFGELHYNCAGSTETGDYLSLTKTTAYTDGAVFLLGKYYLIPGVSYQVTPLITATGSLITNLTDPSALFSPYIEYNIAENIYLSGGGYIGFGKGPEITYPVLPFLPVIRTQSEFGLYPSVYFISFRIYY